jgi:hypothetical protein
MAPKGVPYFGEPYRKARRQVNEGAAASNSLKNRGKIGRTKNFSKNCVSGVDTF